MKTWKWLPGAVLLLFLCCPIAAWAVVDAPAQGYVGDYANVLSEETEQYIITQDAKLDEATGAQIVVVTVDFLDGMTAEEYAYTIFNEWGIGDAEKDNGLLLLLAIGEEDYWAMQGKGLEGVLSSGMLGDYLYEYLEPDFAVGNYDAGVQKVFDAFYNWYDNYYQLDGQTVVAGTTAFEKNGETAGQQPQREKDSSLLWLILLFILIVVLISMYRRHRDRKGKDQYWHGGGGGGSADHDEVWLPRMPRRGVYIPPQSPASRREDSWLDGDMDDIFGGGSSRGGGAGRSSGGFGGMGRSFGGFKGFGGGGSRGGGAGRR